MELVKRRILCFIISSIELTSAFLAGRTEIILPHDRFVLESSSSNNADSTICSQRRSILMSTIIATFGTVLKTDRALAADKLNDIVGQLKESSKMMEDIPDLIKAEKWDAVRAILIKPPLSDLWASGGSKQLLKSYADAIGNELPDGDEMAALELREEAISHLRYLDMAVYNNVFNPIATEGESGATKELIRSYYEDPIMEWKASKAAVDALIGLATP